jgi:Ran GTPase-activating protein (RanGAP) involved in mRNA processing and transport
MSAVYVVSLLVLTLAHNFLEDDAVCALAKALSSNATLTKLDLQKVLGTCHGPPITWQNRPSIDSPPYLEPCGEQRS